MKMREQKTVVTLYFMLRHFKLMLQHRARLKDKKFCRDKETYVVTEFRSSRKVFYVATQDTHVATKTRQF